MNFDIPLCIVNDHSDIVPFLLACIRAKKLPMGSLMVHFDAHPDMAVPTPVEQTKYDSVLHWRDPHSLFYDVLSSEGCIGEFLLPILYEKWLSSVIWVRSPWAAQIPDGSHSFQCGDRQPSGQVAVDLRSSYYMDDHVYIPDGSNLLHKRSVHLRVCRAEVLVDMVREILGPALADPQATWVLDVCLDYFSTNNPFLAPLRSALAMAVEQQWRHESDISPKEDPCSEIGRGRGSQCEVDREVDRIVERLQKLYACMKVREWNSTRNTGSDADCKAHELAHHRFYEVLSTPKGQQEARREEFLALYTDENRPIAEEFFDNMLPILQLSGRATSLVREMGPLLLLPHHQSTAAEISRLVEDMTVALHELRTKYPSLKPPSVITIARSAAHSVSSSSCVGGVEDDGYTRSDEVSQIQSLVLAALQDCFSGWGDCVVKLSTYDFSASAHTKCSEGVANFDDNDSGDRNSDKSDYENSDDIYVQCFKLFLKKPASDLVHFEEEGEEPPLKKGRM